MSPGLITREELAQRLALYSDYGGTELNVSNDALLSFKVRNPGSAGRRGPWNVGLSSPIETVSPRGYGFVQGRVTGDGAREWLLNNGTAGELGIYDIVIRGLK